MKLLLIRHADPDYAADSITGRGRREAALLAESLKGVDIKDYYVSPLGRAQATARVVLDAVGRTAQTKDWLREFFVPSPDYNGQKKLIPWDYFPADWTDCPESFDKDAWLRSPLVQSEELPKRHKAVCDGIDEILSEHGYTRSRLYYRAVRPSTDTLALICHLGSSFVIASHLLNISPTQLWHGFFMAPTSKILLCTEERQPGTAYFRCKTFGDISHLNAAGVEPSDSGFFEETYG